MRAWSVLIGIFVVCCLVGIVIAPPTGNQGFADVGSVIGFATLVAVGIERVIEASFIALSGRLGQWWPLSVVRDQFAVFESQTDALLGPVLESVQDACGRPSLPAGPPTPRWRSSRHA